MSQEEVLPNTVIEKTNELILNISQKREKFVPGNDDTGKMISNLIGISIDKSEHSLRAFNWYAHNIHRPGNKVALIHIHSIPDIDVSTDEMGKLLVTSKWKKTAEDSFDECQLLLNSYKQRCEKLDILFELHLSCKQKHKVGSEVIKIIEERGINWIIVGSRGLNTIRRTILGSVSDYLLHHSSVPVTIVPPN